MSAVGVAIGLLTLTRFRINSDLAAFFPKDDPVVEMTHRLYGDAYRGRSVLIVLRNDDPRVLGEVLAPAVDRLRASPFLERVMATREEWLGSRLEWMRESPLVRLSDPSRASLRDRIAGPARRAQLEDTRQRLAVDPLAGTRVAQNDPLGLRWFFEEALERDASPYPVPLRPGSPYVIFDRPSLGLVRVIPREMWWNTPSTLAMLEDLRGRLSSLPVQVEFAGAHVSNATHSPLLMNDLKMQVVSSFALVFLFLAWMTRHPVLPFVLVVPIGLAILCALGYGGLAFGPVAPTTVAVAAILMAQGIDFPIHFQSRYRQQRRTQSLDDSFEIAHVSIGRPVLGAGLTSLAAFLALGASRFPGINQFGLLLAAGLALCMVFSLTVTPLLLRMGDRFIAGREEPVPTAVRIARAIQRSRLRVPIAGTLLAAGLLSWCTVGARGVDVDLDMARVVPPDDPSEKTLSRLEGDLGMSLIPVFALVDASTSVDELRTKAGEVRARGISVVCDGPHELFPSPEALRGREDFLRGTGGWVESTLKEMEGLGFEPAPFRKGLEDLQARLSGPALTVGDLERAKYVDLRNSVRVEYLGRPHWVLALFPPRTPATPGQRAALDVAVRSQLGSEVGIFSAGHAIDHESRLLRRDLAVMASIVVATVAVLALLSVGGIRDGALALVPVTVAAGVMLAVQSSLAGPLNLMSMTALPLVIGIGVDDGIYYVCRHREPDRPDADRTLADIGPGIWGSTATTVVAFASLTLSISQGVAALGLLVMVGRIVALIATVCVLPVLVRGSLPPAASARMGSDYGGQDRT